VAQVVKMAPSMSLESNIVVNLSGRGDKDLREVAEVEARSS
jgi:tryptophan synthase beta chain